MKFNWGTGIVLAFIGFISFIMYFVITMFSSDRFKNDLVTEDYYGAELLYQNDINKLEKSKDFATAISYTRTNEVKEPLIY